jgi:hypothetical protein
MKARPIMKKTFIRTMVWMLVFIITLPAGVFAQSSATPPVFRQEELEQILAPVALYPDPLLVQMMMAATYPLEVVEAARWANANPNLTGDQLAAALEQMRWDPSVKSLVNFPNALAMMDGNIEWTQRLGDAFLAQKDQVMDTIQYLRSRAQGQGNLSTTPEQVVTTRDNVIAIEPANPEVMYAPVYNPSLVYGQWSYPDYPPYYYYPPGYVIGDVIGGILSFGVGMVLGAAWWGYAWGGFDWYNHGVYCNPYYGGGYPYYGGYPYHGNYPYYGRNISNDYLRQHRYAKGPSAGPGSNSEWRHDPSHRRNVAYRDGPTRERYGQMERPMTDGRRGTGGNISNARTTTSTRTGDRLNLEQRQGITGRDPAVSDRRMSAPASNRAGMDQRMPLPVNNISITEQRMTPQASRGSTMDKRKDNSVVVERLATQQRRDAMRLATQTPRQATVSPYGGTARPSYQGQRAMSPSFGGAGAANPSYRGAGTMRQTQRVDAMRPSYQGQGRAVFSGDGREGFSGRTGNSGGNFSGRTGGFGGGSSGRAGGFGGRG